MRHPVPGTWWTLLCPTFPVPLATFHRLFSVPGVAPQGLSLAFCTMGTETGSTELGAGPGCVHSGSEPQASSRPRERVQPAPTPLSSGCDGDMAWQSPGAPHPCPPNRPTEAGEAQLGGATGSSQHSKEQVETALPAALSCSGRQRVRPREPTTSPAPPLSPGTLNTTIKLIQ